MNLGLHNKFIYPKMEKNKLRYPLGWQDFKSLREAGCVYIDKTEEIFNLVDTYKYVFLSRPRRFGKSLLLSTMRYIFEGRKELFEGLKISDIEKEWKPFPVIHLELSAINPDEEFGLEEKFNIQFKVWEKEYGITEIYKSLSARFHEIVMNAYLATGQRVVVLIDEYDNPLINTLHDEEKASKGKEYLEIHIFQPQTS